MKKQKSSSPSPIRVQMLETAASLTSVDRQKVYGDAKTNMTHFAGLLTAYFAPKGVEFSPEDAAMIMVLAKNSRIAVGRYHPDNYIDSAAYTAIAGECGA